MRMNHRAFSYGAAVLASALGVALLSACSTSQQQHGLISEIEGAKMSRHQLDVRLTEFARELSGRMKARSYELFVGAPDSVTRRRALLIAVRSSEMMIDAVSHEDPVISLVDLWALVVQMRDFFDTGQARTFFPEYNEEMVASLNDLEQSIFAIADDLAGSATAESTREKINAWTRSNALDGSFYRPSVAPMLAADLKQRNRSLFSVAETLNESVSRVALRIEILNSQLPQQITWHAAMLIEDLLGDLDIAAVVDQAERVMTMAEQAPRAIEAQRDAVLQEIDRQRADTLDDVDTQRELITAELDRQRTETLASIDATIDDTLTRILHERDATVARFDTTLASTLDRLHDESTAAIAQVESLAAALVGDVDARILGTVDLAFQRLLVLLCLALAGAGGIVAWSRRRPAAR